ncbi:hypothetical protein CYLTODRAFT_438788 [Cylindrobasidium torrendii FP15055 ss-10]|uniref:RING-type domain-containing protein n=1 Tax=Cylindrobasidium torrendii FP15055 ss-10 TaxID=1314674 RepID=A0A0D7AXY0_9AGAR|nr:hypothetical protein CYLTODRAFT_438788 [Cylindrobasidium torrendii FP15055 ss-10]
MATYNYVEPTNSNLVCCICRAPFVDPVTTQACSHTFCRGCISEALEHSLQCPVDRLPLTPEDLTSAGPLIRSLVDELLVSCPNNDCPHVCQRDLLQGHLDACEFLIVDCPEQSCHQMVVRKDAVNGACIHSAVICSECYAEVAMSEYEAHSSTCPDSACSCEHCATEISKSTIELHGETCERAPVVCTHAPNGCSWKGERRLRDGHISSCPYEAIKGFFIIHKDTTAALKEENALLQAKIDALQGHLRATTRDLQVAKAALGPWYTNAVNRTEAGLPIHHPPRSRAPTSASLNPATSPQPPLPGPRASISTLGSDAPNPAPASVTPTHVNATPGPSNTSHDWRAHSSRPSPNISHNWDPSSLTARSIARDVVAPIDLGTSLEGSLHGLRESMVTLSTTVDSVGRRSEIALTNETVRLNEEVMSVRAHLHGLRMQVHAIMMDRNTQVTGRVDEGGGITEGAWIPTRFSQVPGQPQIPLSITKL